MIFECIFQTPNIIPHTTEAKMEDFNLSSVCCLHHKFLIKVKSLHRFWRASLFINKMAQPQHVITGHRLLITWLFWLFVLVIKISSWKGYTQITNEGLVFYKDIGGCRIGFNLIVLTYSCHTLFTEGIFLSSFWIVYIRTASDF